MWTLRVLQVVAFLTPYVPAAIGYTICWFIGVILGGLNVRARRNVLCNLRRVLPTASPIRLRWQALRVFVSVVTNYYDLIRLGHMDRDRVLAMFETEGIEHLTAALTRGRGVIILAAHVGNYNVVPSLPVARGYPTAVVAERVHPEELYTYVNELRASLGVQVIPPGSESLRPIIRLLRRNGILILAGDRDVVGSGMPVPLFGEPARLPTGPVLLAMRTGAALIPAGTVRKGSRRSLAFVEPAIEMVDTGDWDVDLRVNMIRMAEALERMIRRDPGQWAVLQPVWDTTTPADEGAPRAPRRRTRGRQEPAEPSASTTR